MLKYTSIFILFFIKTLEAGTVFDLQNPIGTSAFGPLSRLMFVGSAAPSTGDAALAALAVAGPNDATFTGITPENVYINGSQDAQANPLFGAEISLLALNGSTKLETDAFPAVVIAGDPNHVYLISSYAQTNKPELLISSQLQDTSGAAASAIDALVGSIPSVLFAAVSPQSGTFGDAGSGITLGRLVTTTQLQFAVSAPVDITSSLVAIGTPLQSLTNPKLYVSSYKARLGLEDGNIGTLFSGYNLVTGNAPGSGGIAVVSSLDNVGDSFLVLQQIVSSTPVTTDSIVATTSSNTPVSIHFLSTLFPSVGTQYLVVAGGVGSANINPSNVYALPLTVKGLLADVNSVPFVGINGLREFNTPATVQGDLYTSSSIPAQVGGGAAPGTILSLYTSGDSVIITVPGPTNQTPGIFYSQAIFNANQVISGWTPWQRVVETQNIPEAAFFDRVGSFFWYVMGYGMARPQTVIRTAWEKDSSQLSQLLQASLPLDKGGVQNVLDLPTTSSLFNQSNGCRSSAALFTGFKTVILALTAQDEAGVLTPVTTYSVPEQYITYSGDALGSLKAIIAATVVSDGTQSWLVVGGNGGLAVLAMPDGTGIPNGSIGRNFFGLSPDLQWQKLGNYSNARKLVSQNGLLYILTDTLFERVQITASLVNQTTPFNAVNLATAGELPNKKYLFFSDVLVSDPLVILATSSGTLRGGNGIAVSTATSQNNMSWVPVVMPETTGCSTRLLAITETNLATDLYTSSIPGNLYILAGNVSQGQARVYRYTVQYGSGSVSDSTLQIFNDYYVANSPTFFLTADTYRNFFYTDGLLWSLSRSRYLVEPLYVQTLPVGFKFGNRPQITAASNIFFTQDLSAHSVYQVQRLSGLGSWVIPGDFGLVVHY